METTLHKKIRAACRIIKGKGEDDSHWLLVGAETLWVPEVGAVVTMRRAARAAFIGPILENSEVYPSCGEKRCIRPEHSELRPARRFAS